MRLLLMLCSMLAVSASIFAQKENDVLFTVDDNEVTVSEFKYIYEKNNGDSADYSEQSVKEYLNLYKNFKLKVEEAKAQGLDTVQTLQDELEGYRMQLAKNYLLDNEVLENLAMQAYERMKTDLDISHILFKDDREMTAVEKVEKYRESIMNAESFAEKAKELSDDDDTADDGGRIGYLSAIFPPGFYDMENTVYQLEVGGISEPVRSKAGIHIVKLNAKRPAKGKVDISHILIRNKKNNQSEGMSAEAKIGEVYTKLEEGGNFETLARQYSEDKSTKNKGGHLGEFGVGVFTDDFEEQMFSIENEGGFTKPFKSKLGWHIIKLNEKQSAREQSYKEMAPIIKSELKNSPRLELAKSSLIENIKEESGFTMNMDAYSGFITDLDSTFFNYNWDAGKAGNSEEVLFSFENGDFSKSVGDFQNWLKKNPRERMTLKYKLQEVPAAKRLLDTYIENSTIQYEESRLEEKYPEFRNLMREYREGILLFEVTKNNVWDKASQDTSGLRKYFEKHRENYSWEKRSVVHHFTLNTTDKGVVNKISRNIKNGMSTPDLIEKYNSGDKNLLSYTEKLRKHQDSDEKGTLEDVSYDTKNEITKFYTITEFLEPGPKTLSESRGYVISDYQDHLEKEWISHLNNKFEFDLNKRVLKKLTRD